jgi:hypothetical protein
MFKKTFVFVIALGLVLGFFLAACSQATDSPAETPASGRGGEPDAGKDKDSAAVTGDDADDVYDGDIVDYVEGAESDPFTWTKQSPAIGYIRTLTFSGGDFWATAMYEKNRYRAYHSADGANWEGTAGTFSNAADQSFAASADGQTLVAGGYNGLIARSSDAGQTWKTLPYKNPDNEAEFVNPFSSFASQPIRDNSHVLDIQWIGDKFVAVAATSKIGYSANLGASWKVWSGADYWPGTADHGLGNHIWFRHIISAGAKLFASTDVSLADISDLDNAANWTYVNLEALGPATIVWGGGRFVAGLRDGRVAYINDSKDLADISQWTKTENKVHKAADLATFSGMKIAWGGGYFVAAFPRTYSGGSFGAQARPFKNGVIAYSADGAEWKVIEDIEITGESLKVVYGNGRFIVQDGASLWYSSLK